MKDEHEDKSAKEFDEPESSDLEKKDESPEELFFDGENYLTKEEFFNPPDEEKASDRPKRKMKRSLKIFIATIITAAMLANVFAVWPQLFNFPAAEFLANARDLSSNEEVQEYRESIAVIRTENSKGTGFVFEDGRIMTNEHVIRDGFEVTAHFENGDSYVTEVIESNADLDIAILEVANEEFHHPALELSSGWEENEEIYIIGNPMFFNYIANAGTLLEHVPMQSKSEEVIALDAPVYRGSSGSPVINHEGEAAGVVYATSSINLEGESSRVGLAIDMENILEEMEALN